jgi:hypothetical protein
MAVQTVTYGTSTAIVISLASLTSSATVGRESTAVDNSSNKYLDAIVQGKIVLQSGSPANDKAVYLYAYGSEDGSTFTDNATGTDAGITLRVPSIIVPIGVIACPDSGALTYESQPMSVAAAFGGWLPREWGIVVRNFTGVTFNATGGSHVFTYTGITLTSA